MIKYVIHAKKWFDQVNGNTYHAIRVLDTKKHKLISSDFCYGYGDQFMETARTTMIKRGWLNSENKRFSIENYNQLHIIVENDCKKKEVIAWGNNQY
jgi:hypothetical protein